MKAKKSSALRAMSLLTLGILLTLFGLIQLLTVAINPSNPESKSTISITSSTELSKESNSSVPGGASSVRPMVSSSDSSILFASKEGSQTHQIWKMNLDGSSKTRLTDDQNYEHEWSRPSPDGKTIMYMRAAKGSSVNFALDSNELWLMNVDGSNKRSIISSSKKESFGWKGMGHSEWSPDSNKIVLVATLRNLTSHIYVVDVNGNNPEQLTKDTKIDGHNTLPLDPSWSSTNQIVYARSWNCFLICEFQDIFVMDYNTRVERRVTNDPHWNFDPYISPDGKTYLWLSFRTSSIMCPCDLIKGNVEGNLNAQAVIADDGANANGTFSSDSQQVLFLKSVGFKQVLHRINIDGSGLASLNPTDAGQSGIASFVPTHSSAPITSQKTKNETNPTVTATTKSKIPVSSKLEQSQDDTKSKSVPDSDVEAREVKRSAGLGDYTQTASEPIRSANQDNRSSNLGFALILIAFGISPIIAGAIMLKRRSKS